MSEFKNAVDNIITIRHAAAMFHVHRSTIRYHIDRGNIRYKTVSSGNRRTYLLWLPDLIKIYPQTKIVDTFTTTASK